MLHQRAAELDFWEKEETYRKKALELLEHMKEFYQDYEESAKGYIPKDYDIKGLLAFQERKILNLKYRYSQQILEKYKNHYIHGVMEEIKER